MKRSTVGRHGQWWSDQGAGCESHSGGDELGQLGRPGDREQRHWALPGSSLGLRGPLGRLQGCTSGSYTVGEIAMSDFSFFSP